MFKVYVRGYRGDTFFSKAIKWITRGEYSHISLVFKDLETKSYTEIEALEGRGVIQHLPNLEDTYDFDEYYVPLDLEQAYTAYEEAKKLLGGKYDKKGVAGFLIHRKMHSPVKWFCSELAAYVLLNAGYALSRREPYRETPSSVMESLRLIA